MVMRGEALYLDGDHEERLYPGDSCVVLGGGRHSVSNPTQEETELMAVILTY